MIGARSLSARLMISLLSALWLGAGPIVFAVNVLNLEGLHGLKLWEWPGLASNGIADLVIESIVRTSDGRLRNCSDATP